MKKFFLIIVANALVVTSFGGNQDRAGTSGASQLLINPWARNTGWAGANSGSARGLESMFLNVAGTAFTKKTEVLFTHTNWLKGTDISVNAFGFTQHVGETGVIGLGIVSIDAGDIERTTVDNPEGGLGTFNPRFMNIGLSYAKGFSDNIFGGATIKIINEYISDVSARGIAIDAGLQYVTGMNDRVKFGIALKNIGPKMRYSGDGLSFRTSLPNGQSGSFLVSKRSAYFELPSLINIGASYDFYLSKDSLKMKDHRITPAFTFTSNSFDNDDYKAGIEYGFRNFLMVRAGYSMYKGIFKEETQTSAYTGICAGFTVEVPFGKEKKSSFAFDYSYRDTNPFEGTHSFGVRVNL